MKRFLVFFCLRIRDHRLSSWSLSPSRSSPFYTISSIAREADSEGNSDEFRVWSALIWLKTFNAFHGNIGKFHELDYALKFP